MSVRPETVGPPEWLASSAEPTVLFRWRAVGGKLTRWHAAGMIVTDFHGRAVMPRGGLDVFTGAMVARCGAHIPTDSMSRLPLLALDLSSSRYDAGDLLRSDVVSVTMEPEFEWPDKVLNETCSSCLYAIASPAGRRMGWGGRA